MVWLKNHDVNNDIYTSILELYNFAFAVGLEARSLSPSKLDEIGSFKPQRMMSIFGALVSNDRAAESVEEE